MSFDMLMRTGYILKTLSHEYSLFYRGRQAVGFIPVHVDGSSFYLYTVWRLVMF